MEDPKPQTTFSWPPLESDPTILTTYLHNIGMSKEWAFHQVFGLDPDLLAMVPQPAKALIIAIQRTKKTDQTKYETTPMPYYQKQTKALDNACGLIACIHAVLNNRDVIQLESNSGLQELEKTTAQMKPEDRASFLQNFNKIKQSHQSYAAQGQSQLCEKQSDVKHHFIALVRNSKGQLVELDGMQPAGPRVMGECGQDDFLLKAGQQVLKRVNEGFITESLSCIALAKGEAM